MELKIKGIYKHFKGDYYLVEDIGYDSETLEECVIYRSLYGNGKLFIRTYKSFTEKVDKEKYPNIEQEYRFQLQEIKSKRK